jgi:hypothetical protein
VSSRQAEKERLRQARLACEASERRASARRRRLQLGVAAGALAAVVVVVALAARGTPARSAGAGRAGAPLLASTRGEATGRTVDGIRCQSTEQTLFHVHAHLAVYVGGRPRAIPEGIGIAPPRVVETTSQGPFVAGGSCLYWLHSHTADGVIHIESPVVRTYTLGDYFDIWGRPLSADRVGPTRGRVTAYVDGRRFTGDPRSIPLRAHAVIQLDVGSPVVPPRPYRFPAGL